jgi:hypothetical protein
MVADKPNRSMRGHPVDDREARQGRAGPAAAARAGDLHPFRSRAAPGLVQRRLDVAAIGREPEIGPSHPAGLPGNWRRLGPEQVEAEVR